MKTLLVIAGTRDARRIIAELQGLKLMIHATVATELGREFLAPAPNLQVHTGRRDARELAELIHRVDAAALLDASHPFAAEVSRNAMRACEAAGIPYLRYEREETPLAGPRVTVAADFDAAAAQAALIEGNILLTVGSNHLEAFVSRIPDYRDRLYVRVLPESRAIAKCESFGLTARQILALQGPFTMELNREIYRHCQAAVVVTKDSGATGGNPEKLAAAAQLQLPVIMVARPKLDYGRKVYRIPEIVAFARELES